MALLVVAVGTAGAMQPSIPKLPPVDGYNGCFDEDGALIRDLKAHVALGKPAFSQLRTELKNPLWYSKTQEYGRRPKYLYHCTKKKAAENIMREGAIKLSDDSNGDARLGDGVYMTTLPVDWADSKMVAVNNYGDKISRNFENWNKQNAYVRVTYDKLLDQDWVEEINFKQDWQSNFCVPVPQGVLYLNEKIDAEIWFHSMKRQEGELPELFWSAKGGLTPWAKMTKRKHTKYRPGMKWVYDRGWVVVK